ncbi:kielin/chordin-like protein [Vespula maculifrons]|uniref:Kielin/chordin-like protein n=1 Tax=Vespula maculifrons TaxID=7453 RepID=A0ABD2CKQ7_VESMC
MTTRCDFRFLIEKCAFLFLVIIVSTYAKKACNQSNCSGPLKYYESLGCKPVYANKFDCCAVRYNCDHLKLRSKNKCYVNGKEYSIGEKLKEEDRNACDKGCFCAEGSDGFASFRCAIVDCPRIRYPSNCYLKHSPSQCCGGPKVCLDDIKQRPKCNISGEIYYDGERFVVDSDPDLRCYCQPGYQGKNVEPFCKKPNRPYCSQDFRNPRVVYENCAPVYYYGQSLHKDCNFSTRCQNANDTVIRDVGPGRDESLMCMFGNLKMHVGDKLSQPVNTFRPMKCLCEVPPVVTCQYEV